MEILEGKSVAQKISQNFEDRLEKLKIKPNIAVLGIKGNESYDYIMEVNGICS